MIKEMVKGEKEKMLERNLYIKNSYNTDRDSIDLKRFRCESWGNQRHVHRILKFMFMLKVASRGLNVSQPINLIWYQVDETTYIIDQDIWLSFRVLHKFVNTRLFYTIFSHMI